MTTSNGEREVKPLSLAFKLGTIVGMILFIIGGAAAVGTGVFQVWGSVGSIGFIASIAGGGSLVCIALFAEGTLGTLFIYYSFSKPSKISNEPPKFSSHINPKKQKSSSPTMIKKQEDTSLIFQDANKNNLFKEAFDNTPCFNGYKIDLPKKHRFFGITLTSLSLRPSNLFFEALFKGSTLSTTLPGSQELFAFNQDPKNVRTYCEEQDPNREITFSAESVPGVVYKPGVLKPMIVSDLGEIYGNNTYRISFEEILDILDSQRIYVSSLLPKRFYCGLKTALTKQGFVVLPGSDSNPTLLQELQLKNTIIGDFLEKVKNNLDQFDLESEDQFNDLLKLTLYQIGAMVIKTEDFHLFMDGQGKIIQREVGEQDSIRLISACGIRGIHSKKTPKDKNLNIMTETFTTALTAAEKGIAVFPAVGMGVWKGDPDLYWKAFLNGVIQSNNDLECICVNPRHQKSISGKYKGCEGEEFQTILAEYKIKYQDDDQAKEKLNKIFNLYDSQKDVLQFAYQLKRSFPETIISLFNASDPDVTLGNHVGEYVNNINHATTTEENYTAAGTNGICFESATDIHNASYRIVQT